MAFVLTTGSTSAFEQLISEKINDRLKGAIVITREETEGYYMIRAIVRG